MNPSFRLPPAVAAARLRSSSCTSTMSSCREILRSFMIGESVSLTGATVRASERVVSSTSLALAMG